MANNLSWLFCCASVCVHIYFIQMADHFMHCVSKKLEKLFHCCCFPNFLEHIRLLSFPPPCSSCWLFIYFIFLWCCIFQWRKTLAAIIFSCLRTSCAPRRVVTLLLTLQTQLRDFMFRSYLLCPFVCVGCCIPSIPKCCVLCITWIFNNENNWPRRASHTDTLYFTFVNHLSSAIGNFTVSGVTKMFRFVVEFESRKKMPSNTMPLCL